MHSLLQALASNSFERSLTLTDWGTGGSADTRVTKTKAILVDYVVKVK